jgi:hypothetical protein
VKHHIVLEKMARRIEEDAVLYGFEKQWSDGYARNWPSYKWK